MVTKGSEVPSLILSDNLFFPLSTSSFMSASSTDFHSQIMAFGSQYIKKKSYTAV